MARLIRLDSELVRRGLARSRTHAARLIVDGHVTLDGAVVVKPARQVNPAQALEVVPSQGDDYVSRGARKLAGALDALGARGLAPRLEGRRCLDAGASTGGFTDVLLRRGAAHVTAVDVGYGQLAWSLQSDERVTVLAAEDADLLLMVKPQFEVGKERLAHGGVVRDPGMHIESVLTVAARAHELGVGIDAVTASPLPGPAGNVEYFINLHAGRAGTAADLVGDALLAETDRAVAEGPAGRRTEGRQP